MVDHAARLLADGRTSRLEVLTGEAARAGDQIKDILLATERAIALGIAVLAVGVNVAVANHYTEFLLVAPLLANVLFAYTAFMNSELLSLGGYKAAIEEEVNRSLGRSTLVWESQIASRRHHSLPAVVLRCFLVACGVALNVTALVVAFRTRSSGHWGFHHSRLIIGSTLVLIVVTGVMTVASLAAMWRERGKVYERTRNLLQDL
jgi:hypothetical protein